MDSKEWERRSDRIRKNVPNKVVFDIPKRRQNGGRQSGGRQMEAAVERGVTGDEL